jgi:hypothetical protein
VQALADPRELAVEGDSLERRVGDRRGEQQEVAAHPRLT